MFCLAAIFINLSGFFALAIDYDVTVSDNLDMVEVSLEDVFSTEQIVIFNQETEKMKDEEAKRGYTLVSSQVLIPATTTLSNDPYYVTVIDTYTSDPVVLNDTSKGMRYWLDVAWNVYIGTTTKYSWIAATILGVEPSAFYTSYREGDTLTNTTAKTYYRRCYKMHNEILEIDDWYYETRKLVVKEYVDLYTFTTDGNSYRDSDSKDYTFYTEHYFNTDWIDEYVRYACSAGLMVQIDKFA